MFYTSLICKYSSIQIKQRLMITINVHKYIFVSLSNVIQTLLTNKRYIDVKQDL